MVAVDCEVLERGLLVALRAMKVSYLSKRGMVWVARETEDEGMLVEWWLGVFGGVLREGGGWLGGLCRRCAVLRSGKWRG